MSKELTKLKKKCWKLFSEWIRRKDADSNGMVFCYTCDKLIHWKEAQAGHLLDGRSNSILFEEDGVRTQCQACNVWKSGNKENYIPRYIDEMGREKYEEMRRLKNQNRKFSVGELEEMIEDLKTKIRGLG